MACFEAQLFREQGDFDYLLVDHITGDFDAFNFKLFINGQLYLKLSLNTLIITK